AIRIRVVTGGEDRATLLEQEVGRLLRPGERAVGDVARPSDHEDLRLAGWGGREREGLRGAATGAPSRRAAGENGRPRGARSARRGAQQGPPAREQHERREEGD